MFLTLDRYLLAQPCIYRRPQFSHDACLIICAESPVTLCDDNLVLFERALKALAVRLDHAGIIANVAQYISAREEDWLAIIKVKGVKAIAADQS